MRCASSRRAGGVSGPHRRAQSRRVRARSPSRRDQPSGARRRRARARSARCTPTSPFEARRLGAAMVARNIARDARERSSPTSPATGVRLIYCWRGGQRSRALAHVLNEVGWRAMQLDGGYRAYRRHVVAQLDTLPPRFDFVVVCGLTGSGKSRLHRSAAMRRRADARPRSARAPSRFAARRLARRAAAVAKGFRKRLARSRWSTSIPARPVFVESESRRVGVAAAARRAARRACAPGRTLTLRTTLAQRVALLKEDYAHFIGRRGSARATGCSRWPPCTARRRSRAGSRLAEAGDWDTLVGELLERHYDPAYTRSLSANFRVGRRRHSTST